MCNKYNGYSNYPTWAVSLWIDDDPGLQSEIEFLVIDNFDGDKKNLRPIADAIESFLDEIVASETNDLQSKSSMSSDLFTFAYDTVDWWELAENYVENASENGDIELETEEA